MVVHSFSPEDAGHDDYARFADALGLGKAEPDAVTDPVEVEGVSLHLAWVRDVPSE